MKSSMVPFMFKIISAEISWFTFATTPWYECCENCTCWRVSGTTFSSFEELFSTSNFHTTWYSADAHLQSSCIMHCSVSACVRDGYWSLGLFSMFHNTIWCPELLNTSSRREGEVVKACSELHLCSEFELEHWPKTEHICSKCWVPVEVDLKLQFLLPSHALEKLVDDFIFGNGMYSVE